MAHDVNLIRKILLRLADSQRVDTPEDVGLPHTSASELARHRSLVLGLRLAVGHNARTKDGDDAILTGAHD